MFERKRIARQQKKELDLIRDRLIAACGIPAEYIGYKRKGKFLDFLKRDK